MVVGCGREEARITFGERYFVDVIGVGCCVDVEARGLTAHRHGIEFLHGEPERLADFVGGLAADFRGWPGERVWNGAHLRLKASIHAGGHVALGWTLPPDGGWEASVTTWLEAGEQLSGLAADLREFLRSPHRR
ncbi:DUF6228 family protein [Amycolatopsis sp. lyj-112]|uniref:DUF6228 family protein n=1 Tax=Amycolatopsis sp. lyj-112 TaxID=2789288 RepID=UPI003978D033